MLQKTHGDPVILQEDYRVRSWVSSSTQGDDEPTEMEHPGADEELKPEMITSIECIPCRNLNLLWIYDGAYWGLSLRQAGSNLGR